jgi:mannose-6-phosphate isomerase-like protein (cupin superfamily)
MQMFSDHLFPVSSERRPYIFSMLPAALENVPFHQNTACITRYFAKRFPLHVAVHEVSPVSTPPAEYTQLHRHLDSDEINIILSEEELLYKIQIGEEAFVAGKNSCIWIPRGILHAANVLKGAGYFITIRVH